MKANGTMSLHEERAAMEKVHKCNMEAAKYIIKPFNDIEKVCDNPVIVTPYYKVTLNQRIKQWNGSEIKIKIFT